MYLSWSKISKHCTNKETVNIVYKLRRKILGSHETKKLLKLLDNGDYKLEYTKVNKICSITNKYVSKFGVTFIFHTMTKGRLVVLHQETTFMYNQFLVETKELFATNFLQHQHTYLLIVCDKPQNMSTWNSQTVSTQPHRKTNLNTRTYMIINVCVCSTKTTPI